MSDQPKTLADIIADLEALERDGLMVHNAAAPWSPTPLGRIVGEQTKSTEN